MKRLLRPPSLVGAFITMFFLAFTWFGLSSRLGYDDLMNITFSWEPSFKTLLKALIFPFTSTYRPTGSLAYRLLFELFGLNPLPFRVFFYCLLAINLYLVYCLARRLTGSPEIGALSALLYTYHGRFFSIYLNNGTLYDVLCATLSLCTLIYYVRARQRATDLSVFQFAFATVLFILSLNAKEMAAALPAIVLAYELCCHWREFKSPIQFARLLLAPSLWLVIAAFAARAKMGEGSVMHGQPAYAMTFTLAQFLEHWRRLTVEMLYLRD